MKMLSLRLHLFLTGGSKCWLFKGVHRHQKLVATLLYFNSICLKLSSYFLQIFSFRFLVWWRVSQLRCLVNFAQGCPPSVWRPLRRLRKISYKDFRSSSKEIDGFCIIWNGFWSSIWVIQIQFLLIEFPDPKNPEKRINKIFLSANIGPWTVGWHETTVAYQAQTKRRWYHTNRPSCFSLQEKFYVTVFKSHVQ